MKHVETSIYVLAAKFQAVFTIRYENFFFPPLTEFHFELFFLSFQGVFPLGRIFLLCPMPISLWPASINSSWP